MGISRTLLTIASAGFWMAGTLAAQTAKPEGQPPSVVTVQAPGPEGPGAPPFAERIELLGFGGLHGGKVVTGAPFSALATSETTQTLPDGNKITRKTQTTLYRDSQGRSRKEVTLPAIGPFAAQDQPKSFVILQDPVAGKSYVLEMDRKIARLLPARGKRGDPEDHLRFQKRAGQDDANVQKEDLGVQTINGVSAQGTRYTRTIPAGQIGNEKPITITSESWYSPDLQIVVMSKRSDPRFGDTTYQLTNIQRTEPAPSLFAVPEGYSVEAGPPRGRRGFRRDAPEPPPAEAKPPGM